MTPWKIHKVSHLSPSQINSIRECANHWILQRLANVMPPFQGNAATNRGNAVEAAITKKIFNENKSDEECIEAGLKSFDANMALIPDENREKERENIPLMYQQLKQPLLDYGTPLKANNPRNQHGISLQLNKLPLIKGYLDFYYQHMDTIVDIKTTTRLPSGITPSHAIQGAVYAKATGCRVVFAYVTPKKFAFYELENIDNWLNEIRGTLSRIEKLLSLSNDPMEVAQYIIPNYSSWSWKDKQVREIGKKYNGY